MEMGRPVSRPVKARSSAVHTILEAEDIGRGFLCSDLEKTRAESDANQLLIQASPDLIDAAIAAEAVLARGRWIKGSTDPESIALYKLRDAIARAMEG
jgi:threonine aldolase